MKKFLTMLALAGVMTACNDGDDDTDDGDTLTPVDTMTTPTPMPDSLSNDSLNRVSSDTMLKK